MKKVIGYIGLSTEQFIEQQVKIENYCYKNDLKLTSIIEVKISPKKSDKENRTDKLDELQKNDILIVSALDKLGRSTLQVLNLLDNLGNKGVIIHIIDENLIIDKNTTHSTHTIFSALLELEKGFINTRTQAGLERKKQLGIANGRPKGSISASMYDDDKEKIIKLLGYRISTAKIVKNLGYGTRQSLTTYIKERLDKKQCHLKMKNERLPPILKWAGGKTEELHHIHANLPSTFNNYYEPFVGGGAVFLSLDANKLFINDKSGELIALYSAIGSKNEQFFAAVNTMMNHWELLEKFVENNKKVMVEKYISYSQNKLDETAIKNWIISFILEHSIEFDGTLDSAFMINIDNFLSEIKTNIMNKMKRMKKLELERGTLSESDIIQNIESAFKAAFYTHFRHLYNNISNYKINTSFATAIFFFIRNYAYSGMHRYNKSGEFNVPYGGIGYGAKNLAKKISYLQSEELVAHLQKTYIDNLDFEDFFTQHKPEEHDFIFIDPPYDSTFSTYTQNTFTRNDHERLANYLITECKANWMVVISNTNFIYDLYNKGNIHIDSFDKKYLVNFKNRNDRKAKHLIITNY